MSDKTNEQIVAEALNSTAGPGWAVNSYAVKAILIDLEAANRLVGEPTDEQVERAAKELFEDPLAITDEPYSWDRMVEEDATRADMWRADARRILIAAGVAPQPPQNLRRIISEALREAATWSESTQAVMDAVSPLFAPQAKIADVKNQFKIHIEGLDEHVSVEQPPYTYRMYPDRMEVYKDGVLSHTIGKGILRVPSAGAAPQGQKDPETDNRAAERSTPQAPSLDRLVSVISDAMHESWDDAREYDDAPGEIAHAVLAMLTTPPVYDEAKIAETLGKALLVWERETVIARGPMLSALARAVVASLSGESES